MNKRHIELIAYQDQITRNMIEIVCSGYTTIKEWAYILHDKDTNPDGTPKKAHYHIYLNFGTSQDIELVCSWFQLPLNQAEKIKGRKKDILKYLIHKNAPTKYQYNINDVKTNITDMNLDEPDDIIGDFEHFSYAQMIQHLNTIQDTSQRVRDYKRLKHLWALQCEIWATGGDRNMRVLFIVGDTGTGKSTLAKQYCKINKKDFAISSSNNDPLQDYKGQSVLIMDDMRDSTFPFNDALKILDNHTSSSVRSRYNNKIFNGDMVIITSNVPLDKWYNSIQSTVPGDSLKALYRRITEYIILTKDTITTYQGVNEFGEPSGEPFTIDNFVKVMFLDKQEQADVSSSVIASLMNSPEIQDMVKKSIKAKSDKLLSAKRTLKEKSL
jgi:ABC-type dipeptide/oligopeptide/nickel transport system ATPase subunit